MKDTNNHVCCKNTFKNDDVEKRKQVFNKKWLEIINAYEQEKDIVSYDLQSNPHEL